LSIADLAQKAREAAPAAQSKAKNFLDHIFKKNKDHPALKNWHPPEHVDLKKAWKDVSHHHDDEYWARLKREDPARFREEWNHSLNEVRHHKLDHVTLDDFNELNQDDVKNWMKHPDVPRRWRPHRRHRHHWRRHGHHDGQPDFPDNESLKTCSINYKAVSVMKIVSDKMPQIVGQVELSVLLKTIVGLPSLFLSLLATFFGFKLWRKARRGYRPTFFGAGVSGFNANLQQPMIGRSPSHQYHASYYPSAPTPGNITPVGPPPPGYYSNAQYVPAQMAMPSTQFVAPRAFIPVAPQPVMAQPTQAAASSDSSTAEPAVGSQTQMV